MPNLDLSKNGRMILSGVKDLRELDAYQTQGKTGTYSFPVCTDICARVLKKYPDTFISDKAVEKLLELNRFEEDSLYLRDGDPVLQIDRLYDYQIKAVEWLLFVKRGILADEQGLGKTVMALAAANLVAKNQTLIVCSEAKCQDWKEHADEWMPGHHSVILRGTPDERVKILDEWDDVLVCNYSIARMHSSKMSPQVAIFDEVHKIRNRASSNKDTKSLFKYICSITTSSEYVFLCTASPIVNATSDIWTLLYLCDPKRFSSYWGFAYRFCHITDGVYGIEVGNVKPNEETNLRRICSPYLLQREGMLDLPTPKKRLYKYRMGRDQRDLYNGMKDCMSAVSSNGESVDAETVLSMITRLRQICIHPKLLFESYSGGSKIDALVDLINEREGKVVVFTAFAEVAVLAEAQLLTAGINSRAFTGSMTNKARSEAVEKFKRGDVQVLIVTHKTGGEGLNLTEADRAIFLDLAWHPAGNKHAARRILRHGQTSENVEIVVIHAEDSIEDHIDNIIREKGEVVLEELLRKFDEAQRRSER